MIQSASNLTRAANDLWRGIERADRAAAQRRVAELRRRHPKLSRDDLHRMLLYAKCLEVGAVSALSSLVGTIPLIGPALGAVVGPLADATVVSTLQAETIVETFAVYEIGLPPRAEQAAILAIAAAHLGARQAGGMVAKGIADEVAQRVGGVLGQRLMPVARVVAATAGDVAVTFAIGARSRAVARMKDARLEEWPDLLRELSMIDERRFTEWAGKAMRTTLDAAGEWSRALVERAGSMWPTLPPAPARPARRRSSRPAAGPRRRRKASPKS
jgi:hypothetical protein